MGVKKGGNGTYYTSRPIISLGILMANVADWNLASSLKGDFVFLFLF